MADHLRTELVIDALDMAIWNRRPAEGLVHQSDQGCQYTSSAFGRRLREAGLVASMGSVGDCDDNAITESFFATLEWELLNRQRFRTQTEARVAVFDYLEGCYNPRRRHSASASSALPTSKGATKPHTPQPSPDPSTEPGQLQGTVDTVACRETTRGKRQSQRSRPDWINCRVGSAQVPAWLVEGLRLGSGMPGTVRPDPSTLGVVGERGSRHEGRSPTRRQAASGQSRWPPADANAGRSQRHLAGRRHRVDTAVLPQGSGRSTGCPSGCPLHQSEEVVAPRPSRTEVVMSSAAETAIDIRPFQLEIPEEELAALRRRIAATRWPSAELVADRSQGVQLATLQALARYWTTDYDLHRVESRLNALPQFTTQIDGVEIHFIHVRSRHENA
jgi:hypothetical protein